MNCFPCFQSQKSKKSESKKMAPTAEVNVPGGSAKDRTSQGENGNIQAQTFTFRELASATKNFRQECLLGEGGFGRVYKGMLHPSGQVVAVKQLDRNGVQGNKDFLVEVATLSLLHHQNLVNLVGYCADGDQRLLVYEFMPGGSVEDHLLDIKPDRKPLDWKTRTKISYGVAQGLEYLHDKANPPVIYRDLKPSNILLDEEFNPKLSDFGLAKLNSVGAKAHVSSVMGTYGYCAPEYSRNGNLTTKSDVYSFGVVLLELITGRRAIDTTKPNDEQNLVAWAQPMLRDPKRFPDMADPNLNRQFPEKNLNQAVAIAAMCVQEEPTARPLMSDVVTALSFLTAVEDAPTPLTPPVMSEELNGGKDSESDSSDGENNNDGSSSVYEDGMSETNGKSKKWGSKSSRKSSGRSQDGSVSSSERSSRESRGDSLKMKSKKYFSLSRKSSNGGNDSLNHQTSTKSSVFSLSQKSSKKSREEERACLSRNSSRSSDSGSHSSLSRNGSRSSHSSGKISLSRSMSRASHDAGMSSRKPRN